MHDTTTATERPTHSAAVLAHGLRAVSRHLMEHKLPAPTSISIDHHRDHVAILVATHDVEAWVESIALDEVVVDEPRPYLDRTAQHTHHLGRVGLGVRVDVHSVAFFPVADEVSA